MATKPRKTIPIPTTIASNNNNKAKVTSLNEVAANINKNKQNSSSSAKASSSSSHEKSVSIATTTATSAPRVEQTVEQNVSQWLYNDLMKHPKRHLFISYVAKLWIQPQKHLQKEQETKFDFDIFYLPELSNEMLPFEKQISNIVSLILSRLDKIQCEISGEVFTQTVHFVTKIKSRFQNQCQLNHFYYVFLTCCLLVLSLLSGSESLAVLLDQYFVDSGVIIQENCFTFDERLQLERLQLALPPCERIFQTPHSKLRHLQSEILFRGLEFDTHISHRTISTLACSILLQYDTL